MLPERTNPSRFLQPFLVNQGQANKTPDHCKAKASKTLLRTWREVHPFVFHDLTFRIFVAVLKP